MTPGQQGEDDSRGGAPAGAVHRLPAVVLAAGALAFTLLVVGVAVVDGMRIASPPRSNLRFSQGEIDVVAVAAGDVLDRAGVRPGDVIVSFSGRTFIHTLDFADTFRALRPGDTAPLVVRRDGELRELRLETWRNLTPFNTAIYGLVITILIALGAGVWAARPRQSAALIFLLLCLATAISNATNLTWPAGSAWPQRLLTLAYTGPGMVVSALLLHLFVVFPERGRLQRMLFPVVAVAYGLQLGLGVTYLSATLSTLAADLLASRGIRPALFAAYGPAVVACYALAGISLLATAISHARHQVRQQARLLAMAFALLAASYAALVLLPLWRRGSFPSSPLLHAFMDLIVPVAVAAAIVAHRLFDIDVLVRHSLVYGAATAAVTALFVAAVGTLGWMARRLRPDLDVVAVAVAAAIAALAFEPLRRRAQLLVDRVFYRRRYSFRVALAHITGRFAAFVETGPAAAFLRQEVQRVLEPSWTAVALRRPAGGDFELLRQGESPAPWATGEAAHGLLRVLGTTNGPSAPAPGAVPEIDPPALVAPIRGREGVLGAVLLGPRPGGAPFLAEDRDFLGMLADVAGPVLERARLHEERSQQQRLAHLGAAASAVAHELKNPLAAVKSTAAVLRRRLGGDPRGAELTEIIEQEADRLHDTVVQVLSYVRPPRAVTAPVDLQALLGQLVATLETEFAAAATRARVTVEVTDTVVWGDSNGLRQLFLNLLINAREAMPAGGTIDITIAPGGADTLDLAVNVVDSGGGFSDEALARAREPFFTTKPLGTGLGLANAARVAAEHGGSLELANHPGGGARVTVQLPRHHRPAPPPAGTADSQAL